MVALTNVQSITVQMRCKSYSGPGFHSPVKNEINGVSVGVKARRRTKNKSVLISADCLHFYAVISVLFESDKQNQLSVMDFGHQKLT